MKRRLFLGMKTLTNLHSVLKSRDIILPTKVCIVKAMGYPIVMYGYETWTIKNTELNGCFRTMVLEKALEHLLDSKEIKPFNPKGNQPWIFIGRTDAEVKSLMLWPPDAKSELIGKDLDTGKDWRKREKGVIENLMVR